MHLLALGAPVRVAAVLLDLDGHLWDLHLLHDARSFLGVLQRPAAVGTAVEGIIVRGSDLRRGKRWSFVARMPRLSAAPTFGLLILAAILWRLDNITGRRLGRIAGVLACCGQLRFQVGDALV